MLKIFKKFHNIVIKKYLHISGNTQFKPCCSRINCALYSRLNSEMSISEHILLYDHCYWNCFLAFIDFIVCWLISSLIQIHQSLLPWQPLNRILQSSWPHLFLPPLLVSLYTLPCLSLPVCHHPVLSFCNTHNVWDRERNEKTQYT